MARLALQWASQVRENGGDVAGALAAGRQALAPLRRRGRAVDAARWCSRSCAGLATQVGDWDEAVRHAESALPVMEALGAVEDAVQLRSVLALADLGAGRLDEAEVALRRIAEDERSERADRLEHRRPDRAGGAGARARRRRPGAAGSTASASQIARDRRMPGMRRAAPS